MARYNISCVVEGPSPKSVEKRLKEAFSKNGEELPVYTVEKVKTAESRADRFSEAEGLVDQAKSIVEELKDEMEQWFDSIPENLQNGDKADEVGEARDVLEDLLGELENLTFEVNFPGMF